MAQNYLLSRERAVNAGSAGGLRAPKSRPFGGGRGIQASQINPTIATIGFQPASIPKTVENVTSKGIQYFMQTTADAAFNYEQRESTFLANEAGLKFQEEARKLYGGYTDPNGNLVPGYASSKGIMAKPAYDEFRNALDERSQSMLSEMEPRIKQKALLQIQATKNQYLNRAATHRVTQLGKAQEQQRFRQRTGIAAELSADSSLLYPDKNTGLLPIDSNGTTVKQRFLNTFSDDKKALEEWWNLIAVVNKKIFLETANTPLTADSPVGREKERYSNIQNAYQKATKFAEEIGKREQAGSPLHIMQTEASIQKWYGESIRASNASVQRVNSLEILARKKRYREGAQILVENNVDPNSPPLPPEFLTYLLEKDRADPKVIQAYNDRHYKRINEMAREDVVNNYERVMTAAAVRGGLTEVYDKAMRDPEIMRDPNAVTRLNKFNSELRNPEMGAMLETTMKEVDNWIKGSRYLKSIGLESKEAVMLQARKVALNFKLAGMNDIQITDKMKELYQTSSVNYRYLPALPMSKRKPDYKAGKKEILRAYVKDWAEAKKRRDLPDESPDKMSDAEYRGYLVIYQDYMKTVSEMDIKTNE